MSKAWGYVLSIIVALLVVAVIVLWSRGGGGGGGDKTLQKLDTLTTWATKSAQEVRETVCEMGFVLDSIRVTAKGGHVVRPVPWRCPTEGVPSTNPPPCCK